MGAANAALDGNVGEEIGVVAVEHGALENGEGKICGATAVGEEFEVEGGDEAVAGEAGAKDDLEGVAFSGKAHVVVFGVDEPDGAARASGQKRGDHGRLGGLGFLAAEAAAHALANDVDLVEA